MKGGGGAGINEATLEEALLAALPAITDGHVLLGTGDSGDIGAAIKTAAKALGKQIRQIVVEKNDGTGNEDITSASITETSLQASITPTAADSVIIGICVARLQAVDASSTASRWAQVVIRKDSTAGEGGAANGSNMYITQDGRNMTTATTTDSISYLTVPCLWTDAPGDTSAHTYTLCAQGGTAQTISYINSTANILSVMVLIEVEP